jgi:hypothetical protein
MCATTFSQNCTSGRLRRIPALNLGHLLDGIDRSGPVQAISAAQNTVKREQSLKSGGFAAIVNHAD